MNLVRKRLINACPISDDDEDEEEDEEPKEVADPSPQPVKAEPKDPSLRQKGRHDPHELHMYTDDELSKLKKQNLMADVELLDGGSIICHDS